MKPITPSQARTLTKSFTTPAAKGKAKAKPPNPFKWLKRQTWRFLIAYVLLRTGADFAPMFINHASNQFQAEIKAEGQRQVAKRLEALNPFNAPDPGSH